MSEIQIAGVILTMLGVAAWWLTTKGNKEKKQNEENKRGCCLNCYHEQHKDCRTLDCECKNEGCAEIRKKQWQKRRAMLTALVVGQDVYMFSGCYWNKGKVVKVTPSGVDVQTVSEITQTDNELLHFDANGCSYVTELPPSYSSTAHPLSPWGWKGNGTYECGPWYIDDDKPFAERDAQFESGRKLRAAEREALFEKERKLRESGDAKG
jgi:hypothetical protein